MFKVKMKIWTKIAGFSFIELMVVIAIFTSLGTALTASYLQSRHSTSLQIVTDSTQSALRQMQNNTLAGEPYSLTTTARDYGIKISNLGVAYETFVEESGTVAYKALENFVFPTNVSFSNLQITSAGVTQSATDVEIRFFPPFGDILVTAKSGGVILFSEQKNVVVTFRVIFSGTTQYRRMTVDGISGRISEL